MKEKIQIAVEQVVTHLHEKGIPEHLAEAVKVLDKRLAEKHREQKVEEDLIAATVKHWQEHMRDKEGRAIPVDEKLIEHAAGVVVSTGPTKATPEDVIDEAAVLRWSIEDDLNQYGEHKRAVICRQLEGLEAICRLEYHARARW
jgi:hypothetical protein